MFVRFEQEILKTKRYKSRESKYKNGWTKNKYKVHGFDSDADENDNGYVILVNDFGEIWWVVNRHVRVVK